MSNSIPEFRTWPEVERALFALPRQAVAAFAARAARRATPAIPRLAERYGPEAMEWLSAIERVLIVVEAFAEGEPVTRFALDIAADVARCAATATANAARAVGPSPLIEGAELAYAAAAFAADAARAATPERAASFSTRAATMAAGGGDPTPEQLADLRVVSER